MRNWGKLIIAQIRDLTFQRNILVQALIVIEYLLSLSSKAKEKLAKALPENPNKSVIYADLCLNDEDVCPITDLMY